MALPITLVISRKMISDKITAAGLDDAQIFEAVRFNDMDDVISSLFPGVTAVMEPEAEDHVKILLLTASTVEMAAGRPSPSPSGSTRSWRRTPRPRTGTPSTVESAGLTTCEESEDGSVSSASSSSSCA